MFVLTSKLIADTVSLKQFELVGDQWLAGVELSSEFKEPLSAHANIKPHANLCRQASTQENCGLALLLHPTGLYEFEKEADKIR